MLQAYFGALTLLLLVAMVLVRVSIMSRGGTNAMHFGRTDKKDFFILPFALFYFYIVFAAAFRLPTVSKQRIFHSPVVSWFGAALCVAGLLLLLLSLVAFGKNFRVGIDTDQPGRLVTTGVFAVSRNPIYVAFAFALLGEFLLFANWVLLIYLLPAVWLFNRQVSREEKYLSEHYGQEYAVYCRRVRRYL